MRKQCYGGQVFHLLVLKWKLADPLLSQWEIGYLDSVLAVSQ